jgi:type II secretory pathway pseudopilin PulG
MTMMFHPLHTDEPAWARQSAGYALVMALLLLVLASLAVTLAVQKAQTEAQREREAELLFVGNQFRQAIRAYALAPGLPAQYPETLEDLLVDKRWPVTRRYLRRIFPDPMTGRADWELDKAQGRIVGVHSASGRAPLRHAGFSLDDAAFEQAQTYADWRFSAAAMSGRGRGSPQPRQTPDAQPAPRGGATPGNTDPAPTAGTDPSANGQRP